MEEALVRDELPIQSIYERGEDCTATVPVHLKILELPTEVRKDTSFIEGAREVVEQWYNEDMEYHLGVLQKWNDPTGPLKGYEKFNDSWTLEGNLNGNEFLDLSWNEGSESHVIKYIEIPIILANQKNEQGNFYTPEFCREKDWLEIMYRKANDSEYVRMSPEKMRTYGEETGIAKINLKRGIAEVQGHAFCSDYHDNMAKTLLLRDFAVFYLNNLLEEILGIQ